jgi:hypothetical protein
MQERRLLDLIKELPPERVTEVEDFVEFLAERERKRADSGQATGAKRRSARALLADMPGARLFKTSNEVDEYLRREREAWDD